MNYILSRNAEVRLQPIAEVRTSWSSPLEMFRDTLEHEQKVTAMINNLAAIAAGDKDYASSNMLVWFIDEQVEAVRAQVGDKKVLLALSGGVDSSVVAALLIKAIGKQLICVHVNHGLMRKGESEQVVDVFKNQMDANLVYVDATDRFLDLLAGVAEPERKRKIIAPSSSASSRRRPARSPTTSTSWHRAPSTPTSSSPTA